eukprot:gene9735-2062_t
MDRMEIEGVDVFSNSEQKLTEFQTVMNSIRENINQIKKDPKNSKELKKEGMMLFLKLKNSHKSVQISNEEVVGELDVYKKKIDELQLQLQSLQYESNHIQREISTCKNFESRLNQIQNLITKEEYIKYTKDNEKDEHKFELNLLNFELKERQKNSETIKQLQEEEIQIKKEIEDKKQQQNLFKESIKKLFITSEPLQKILNDPVTETRKTHSMVRNLPKPLYILYCTMEAYQQQFDEKIELKIEGNDEEAQKYWIEKSEEHLNKKQKNDLLIDFPTYVTVKLDEMEIHFHYLYESNLITVNSNIDILPSLYENDDGTKSPNVHILSDYDFSNFEHGKPFKWAQILGNLDFLEPLKNNSEKSSTIPKLNVKKLFERIKFKKEAMSSVTNQIKNLENLIIPKFKKISIPLRIKFTEMLLKEDGIYHLTFKKKSLQIQVSMKVIKEEYPMIPPHFEIKSIPMKINYEIPKEFMNLVDNEALELRNEEEFHHTAFHHIEDEVNIIIPKEFGLNLDLLDHQIIHLIQCLNIFLEKEGETNMMILDEKNREITTKFCLNSTLGIDRKRSYQYDEKLGIFTQRLK